MKKMFKIVIFTLLISMIFISPVSASSHDSHSHLNEGKSSEVHNHDSHSDLVAEDGEVGILYIPCEGTGQKHLMTGRSMGQVELTTGGIYEHNLYQCIGCSMGIISASNPYNIPRVPPGNIIKVTLPHQASYGYDFTNKGKKYSFTYESSWTSGYFANIDFIR